MFTYFFSLLVSAGRISRVGTLAARVSPPVKDYPGSGRSRLSKNQWRYTFKDINILSNIHGKAQTRKGSKVRRGVGIVEGVGRVRDRFQGPL